MKDNRCECCGEYIGEEGGRICSCDTGSCQRCNGINGMGVYC